MNMSFLLAGSASSNPIVFTLAVGLMLAWKVAGYYGVDRYLLPRLGTPWRPAWPSLAHARVRRPAERPESPISLSLSGLTRRHSRRVVHLLGNAQGV
jgi:hypothetical protein